MSTFDYLSGALRVKATAPEDWANLSKLPFWEDPNNDQWGSTLCRVLYHETIHFWQILSSGYLANLVSDEWRRLLEYERTERLPQENAGARRYIESNDNRPFNNRELVEAWARYWDVHTRSPVRIIEEERLDANGFAILEIQEPKSLGPVSYTSEAFDLVMQIGPDCKMYGRPYRWLLEKFQAHSAFVSVLFPIITHAAFGSPDPIIIFCNSFERAWKSTLIRNRIDSRTGSINLDWFALWSTVINEAVTPSLIENNFPSFTSGLDVIARGPLKTHPIYAEYLHKIFIKGFLNMYRPVPRGQGENDLLEVEALVNAPKSDIMIPFGLPGQPFYRLMLSTLAPPPTIKFDNFVWAAHRPVVLKVTAAREGQAFNDTFLQMSNEIEKRIKRLRSAEKAVSLGLPANAFEVKK